MMMQISFLGYLWNFTVKKQALDNGSWEKTNTTHCNNVSIWARHWFCYGGSAVEFNSTLDKGPKRIKVLSRYCLEGLWSVIVLVVVTIVLPNTSLTR